MRIAYLASRYPWPSQAFLTREVRGLRAAGVEVDTVTVRAPGPEALPTPEDRQEAERTEHLLPGGVAALLAAHLGALLRSPRSYLGTLATAWRLAGPGSRAHLWSLFYFAEAVLLRRLCRRRGIGHVHAVQFADGAGDVALLAAHGGGEGGRPGSFSISVHGPGELFEVTRYGLPEKVRRASFVTVPAEFTRSQLAALVEDRHVGKIEVVRMGVEPERFPPSPPPGRRGDGVRVLCVARLVRHKGHATLLRAVAKLRDEGLALRVALVGEGPERAGLERLRAELGIEDVVEFRGLAGQDELPALLADADVFCLPTLAETVGVASMEAMAAGRPVVSSRLMGVPELVEDGVSGLLVTPGREGELAKALRRLAEEPELRERLAAEGRQRVLESFDSAREAARLSELLGRAAI
ncbi:MAG TPA: glycosyltransferase family 4 protein [Solirubrobacterales bacterium]|nr:glycosyltransferase family 4 protein [Solirubrobacterales bacterium]